MLQGTLQNALSVSYIGVISQKLEGTNIKYLNKRVLGTQRPKKSGVPENSRQLQEQRENRRKKVRTNNLTRVGKLPTSSRQKERDLIKSIKYMILLL